MQQFFTILQLLGNANHVREESENGGEQEAAIPLPEVSSAPSWFEFSSFLLTFAAEADMFSQAGVTYRRLRK